MSRMHVRLEGVRARFDGAAQKGLDKRKAEGRRASEQNMREAMAEAARADYERNTADLTDQQAAFYRAEMRRLLALAARPAATPSARAAAESLFKLEAA